MINTKQLYQQSIPKLVTDLKLGNIMAVPKIEKVVINMGIGKIRDQSALIENLKSDLAKITGQKPVVTKAKQAISGFKLQKGQPVGLKVTLRRQRMYDFVDRLVNTVLPAMRDFRGIDLSQIDQKGNLNIGLSEHTLFPEIGFEQIGKTHGLAVTIVAKVEKRQQAISLYRTLGIPIKEQ